MSFRATLLGLTLIAGGLSACSEKAQDQTEAAGNAIGADIERGFENASRHVDEAGDRAEAEANRLGNKIENATDDAADATGKALENAGRDLRDNK